MYFKSQDGGANRVAVNNGLMDLYLRALAIDPVSPDLLDAGTAEGGVFKSTDSGRHWSPVNCGLGDGNAQALAVDPDDRQTLYAGTGAAGVGGVPGSGDMLPRFGAGVFTSTDGGIT